MATGYATHKVLDLKVSETRKWKDIRDVFLEADSNSQMPIEIITADAWNDIRACAKNLNRLITLIIHKYKKLYEDVVIEKYNYEDNIRKTTTIGVKSDFVKRRAKREYFYMESIENLNSQPKKKRGRPKGVKNGQKKKKRVRQVKKKRGRKGFRMVFNRGKRGYAKVEPYRKTIRVGKEISPAVAAALGEVVNSYALKYI